MSKQKINISKILSHYAVGTKLYSPIIGDVSLVEVYNSDSGSDMFLVKGQNEIGRNIDLEFCPNGHFFYATPNAECLIFPSKKMRDWSKFAWQRGNVLVSDNGKVEVIFERFNDDEYTSFLGRHYLLSKEDGHYEYKSKQHIFRTKDFNLETEDAAQNYIKVIEEKNSGRFNLETLEFEPKLMSYKELFTFLRCSSAEVEPKLMSYKEYKDNFSSPSTPCLFKPFDKVLVRDWENQKWHCNIYSHYSCNSHYPNVCADGGYKFCIPYEGNEHLLGTDKGVDEQEGGKQ